MGRSAGKRSVPFQSQIPCSVSSIESVFHDGDIQNTTPLENSKRLAPPRNWVIPWFPNSKTFFKTKNALPSSFQKLSRAFCSLSDWKATCKPPVPFDGNEQSAKVGCYHFAVNQGLEFWKDVISLGYFTPEYHNFLIPTRCKNARLNGFCLDVIYFCSSENFESPYYPGYTMDAYQNLISSDKSLLGYMVIALVGLIVL